MPADRRVTDCISCHSAVSGDARHEVMTSEVTSEVSDVTDRVTWTGQSVRWGPGCCERRAVHSAVAMETGDARLSCVSRGQPLAVSRVQILLRHLRHVLAASYASPPGYVTASSADRVTMSPLRLRHCVTSLAASLCHPPAASSASPSGRLLLMATLSNCDSS